MFFHNVNFSSDKEELEAELANAQARGWKDTALRVEGALITRGFAEPNGLRKALDEICPNPNSRQIITHEGTRYRCRYFPIEETRWGRDKYSHETMWGRFWEPLGPPKAKATRK